MGFCYLLEGRIYAEAAGFMGLCIFLIREANEEVTAESLMVILPFSLTRTWFEQVIDPSHPFLHKN